MISELADASLSGSPGLLGRRRQAVFVSDFVHLDRPFERVAGRLFDPEGEWLHTAHRSAGWQRFNLTLEEPRYSGRSVVVPMRWEPRNLERLLPTLEADVELSDIGIDRCRLSLSGRYRVPLAQFGIVVDRLAMHGVAEAAVRRFLSDVAETLESTCPL